ncbi:MAG: hypothetical protein KAH44_04605 [Oricola sp.]|nr:hypothetical protein [Oricola sp.]
MRKDSEIALRRQLAAEDANRAKSTFLANMSHESMYFDDLCPIPFVQCVQ